MKEQTSKILVKCPFLPKGFKVMVPLCTPNKSIHMSIAKCSGFDWETVNVIVYFKDCRTSSETACKAATFT